MDFFLRFLLLLLLSEIFVLLKFLLFKKRAVVFAVLCFFIFLCFFSVEILRQFWTLFCFRFGFSSWLCFCLVVPFLLGYLQIGRNVYAETYFVFVWRCVGVSVCVCVIIRECAANKKLSATFDSDIVGKCVDIFFLSFFSSFRFTL